VIGFPQPVARLVGDRQYELRAEDGSKVGTLSVRNGTAWGFSAFIRRRGLEEGDCLIILIDTARGIAVARAGTVELLQAYQDGEGEGPKHLIKRSSDLIREMEGTELETFVES
jgi:bifunctional DNA-binding transcriptional regulator/antitoxin component of YhaV-PrlF toxin-antitoxin module